MKGLISAFTFLVKKKRGNNKNREMSLLINLKKMILGETWGMSDTCKTENF
jgi:hypothetical protein